MATFNFFQSIQARYSDLDAQGHVNNARFVSYIEEARFNYLTHLGLWDGASFLDLGLIVADVHVSYQAPIALWQSIRVGVRVSKLGNKSLVFEYMIEDAETHKTIATAETVMVSYDYRAHATQPIPAEWRARIEAFENR
jgi:acyl-CoA thioester hydrolase